MVTHCNPSVGRLKQGDWEFLASLGYKGKPCLKIKPILGALIVARGGSQRLDLCELLNLSFTTCKAGTAQEEPPKHAMKPVRP